MTALWNQSLIPQIDINGDPIIGEQAFFYDATTTTPQVVYSTSALSTALDQPILTDALGRFPAVFLSPTPGTYRVKVLDPTGGLVYDVDGISVPQNADYVPPSAGSTDPTLLLSTGMIMDRHGTDVLAGWARLNGRTLGNAASGATERANADTLALFTYLWTQDSTLAVSGGRGGTAAGDFAANKALSLPDYRSRSRIGRGSMGNSAASIIADAQFDSSETADTLGATAGAATHALTSAEMPSHTHTLTDPGHVHSITDPGHTHSIPMTSGTGGGGDPVAGNSGAAARTTGSNTTGISVQSHATGITLANTGSGTAHTVVQPSVAVTTYIKL